VARVRRLVPLVLALGSVLVLPSACDEDDNASPERPLSPTALEPYRGLGTWVDVYDYVPGFQENGGPPPVTPESVDDMAALGIDTLYLQAAQADPRIAGQTVERELLGDFLERAHIAGVRVVAWYLPRFGDVDADLARIGALHRFRFGGERFDGLALDIEWLDDVPDPTFRSAALVDLSNRVRELVGERYAVGAIVLEPILLEVVNPDLWPDFPWRDVSSLYDVWLPMTYWTNRRPESGYREGFAYTEENVRRLRANLDEDDARVHTIGGIGDGASALDYEGFVRASREQHAIGWSVYDYNTVVSSAWPRLRPEG
jgi:hypothetical protein